MLINSICHHVVCRRSCVGWRHLATQTALTRRVCRKSCLTFGSRWWQLTSCVSWRNQRLSSGSRLCSWHTFTEPTSTIHCRWPRAPPCVTSLDQLSYCVTTRRHAGTNDLSSTTTPAIHDAPRFKGWFSRPLRRNLILLGLTANIVAYKLWK